MITTERMQPTEHKEKPILPLIVRKLTPLALLALAAITPDVKPSMLTAHYANVSGASLTNRQEEKEIVFTPGITVIDFAPSEPTEGIVQEDFVTNEELLKTMLGNDSITKRLREAYGNDFIKEFMPNMDPNFQFLANSLDIVTDPIIKDYIYKSFDHYFNHGKSVENEMNEAWKSFGLENQGVKMIPLQSIFDEKSLKFFRDDLGNPGISLRFDYQRIIELLRNDKNRIINMSFQVGDIQMVQVKRERVFIPSQPGSKPTATIIEHENPYVKIMGAYRPEVAQKNISELFEIARAYPDKLFIAAAGNEGEDLRAGLEALKKQRPNNILFAAEWKDGPKKDVYGSDVYVDNSTFHVKEGSTDSVFITSIHADTLSQRGLTMNAIISTIKKASSRVVKYLSNDGRENTTLLLDPPELSSLKIDRKKKSTIVFDVSWLKERLKKKFKS